MKPELKEAWLEMRRRPEYMAQRLLPKQPHDGQTRWLNQANGYINILVPGNRWGKSTVIAMRHIHKCMFKVGSKPKPGETWRDMPYETMSAAMSFDQADIVFREAERLLSDPRIAPFVTKIRATPFPSITFYNGSVFHCRSASDNGKYLDGHAYRYVSIDEAGWIDNLKGLMNGVILMRLAGGGSVDLIGTPKGYGDLYWYANRGLRGVKGYYAQRGSIFDNPHLPPEDIKRRDELLAQSDPRLRDQVIYGHFVSLTGMAFTQDQLDQAFDPELPAHQDYVPGRKYIQAWDLGRRTDYTVGVTFDVTEKPYVMVDFIRLNKVPWDAIFSLIRSKRDEYHIHMPRIDATGPLGDVAEESLASIGVMVDPIRISNGQMKTDLVNTLQVALDEGRKVVGERTVLDEASMPMIVPDLEPAGGEWGLIRMPSIPVLLDEFGRYQLDDKRLTQDCVMAVALAAGEMVDGMLPEPVVGGLFG